MQATPDPPQAIVGFLTGPTASGKSALAVEVARAQDLEIISADSMQVYRGMEIGTGVIAEGDRQGVRHHLLAVADPRDDFHAGRFAEEARRIAREALEQRGRRTLVAGGSGMWIEALREGLFAGPPRDEKLRAELRAEMARDGTVALHERLARVDPEMATRLPPRDHVRVVRALEVHALTGRTLTEWYREDAERRAHLTDLLPLVVIECPREELDRRINRRVEEMLAAGWVEEARALRALELPAHSPARKAIGYRELDALLDGTGGIAEVTERIQAATRQYARRQMTWFRGQRGVRWLREPDAGAAARLLGIG